MGRDDKFLFFLFFFIFRPRYCTSVMMRGAATCSPLRKKIVSPEQQHFYFFIIRQKILFSLTSHGLHFHSVDPANFIFFYFFLFFFRDTPPSCRSQQRRSEKKIFFSRRVAGINFPKAFRHNGGGFRWQSASGSGVICVRFYTVINNCFFWSSLNFKVCGCGVNWVYIYIYIWVGVYRVT